MFNQAPQKKAKPSTESSSFSHLILGLAVGAFAGLILAPQDGEKTRKQLLKSSKPAMSHLKKFLDEYGDEGYEKFENYLNKAQKSETNAHTSVESDNVVRKRGRPRKYPVGDAKMHW